MMFHASYDRDEESGIASVVSGRLYEKFNSSDTRRVEVRTVVDYTDTRLALKIVCDFV